MTAAESQDQNTDINSPAQATEGQADEWRQLAQEAARWPDHPGVQLLREQHVNPLLEQKGLGHLVMDKEVKAGARFLNRHGRLPTGEVDAVVHYLRQNGTPIQEKAGDRTVAYLDFTADPALVNDGLLTGDAESVERQIDARIIKPRDIPESYFELRHRIKRKEEGEEAEFTAQDRQRETEAVCANQRDSLTKWMDYLAAQRDSFPGWFRRYAWDAAVTLGAYNKKTGQFTARTADTVAPYPEVNGEALGYVYDAVRKFYILQDGQVGDPELRRLLSDGSFARLYGHALQAPEVLQQKRQEGSWAKFAQTADPVDVRRLTDSLEGHNTEWCVATEGSAGLVLKHADMHIYYTADEDGKYSVPRAAIRVRNGKVIEVAGLESDQELESDMMVAAADKVISLEGGGGYRARAEDVKRFAMLHATLQNNPEAALSKDDITFLYELDHEIQAFGRKRDPRIDKLKESRGDRDHGEIRAIAIEHIQGGLLEGLAGYRAVTTQLEGAPQVDDTEVHRMFEAQLAEWQERGVLAYAAERAVTHGELYTPICVPNNMASAEQIATMVRGLHQDRARQLRIVDNLYDQYSPAELSGGSVEDVAVRFSLMPNKPTREVNKQHIEEQRAGLATLQSESPRLGFHVPSVLDSITYWHVLFANGDVAACHGTLRKTLTAHFNLKPKQVQVSYGRYSLVVPQTLINNLGDMDMGYTRLDITNTGGRIALR